LLIEEEKGQPTIGRTSEIDNQQSEIELI